MRIFRTFPTVKMDGNVAIHAFLMALEERYKENNNELPRKCNPADRRGPRKCNPNNVWHL